VYDIKITQNLEKGAIDQVDWNAVLPEAKAKVGTAEDDVMLGKSAVSCSLVEPGQAALASEVVPPPPLSLIVPPPSLATASPSGHHVATSSTSNRAPLSASGNVSSASVGRPPLATTRRTQVAA
jgi:hypothetical protein